MINEKHLTFKIDGEWFTNFVRTRFWEEKCGYENIIKTIQNSLRGNLPEEICIEILEGRKKLVGINEFELVDDNEKIKPLKKIENEDKEDYKETIFFKKTMEILNNHLTHQFMNDEISELNLLSRSQKFDTTPIFISEIYAGWDGFIDKKGNFYATKPIGVSWHNGTAFCHNEFAIQYLEENQIKTDKDPKDYLIYDLGWCDYSHMILSECGVDVNKPKRLTKRQEETLFKLFELNKDDWKEYYDLLKQ